MPFGNLLEKKYIKPGEYLWSKDKKYKAEIQADTSLVWNGKAGSIHIISALVTGREKQNGWDFWYVKRGRKMLSIEELRQDYFRKYLS